MRSFLLLIALLVLVPFINSAPNPLVGDWKGPLLNNHTETFDFKFYETPHHNKRRLFCNVTTPQNLTWHHEAIIDDRVVPHEIDLLRKQSNETNVILGIYELRTHHTHKMLLLALGMIDSAIRPHTFIPSNTTDVFNLRKIA
jgi:hypothetical protein